MTISKKLETIYHNGQPDGIRSIRRNLSTMTTDDHLCNSPPTPIRGEKYFRNYSSGYLLFDQRE